MALIYMVGTEESIKHNSYIDGPNPNKQWLLNNMKDGQILVAKRQDSETSIASMQIMLNGELVDYVIISPTNPESN